LECGLSPGFALASVHTRRDASGDVTLFSWMVINIVERQSPTPLNAAPATCSLNNKHRRSQTEADIITINIWSLPASGPEIESSLPYCSDTHKLYFTIKKTIVHDQDEKKEKQRRINENVHTEKLSLT